MSKKPAEIKAAEVEVQFSLVLSELAHRRESQARRLGAAETVGGILVGAGAVVAGLVTTDAGWLTLLVAGPAILAMVMGLIALFPRKVDELNPSYYRGAVLQRDAVSAQLWMVDHVSEHIERRETLIGKRFRLIRIGIIALIGAVMGLLLINLMSGAPMSDNKDNDKGETWPPAAQVEPAAFYNVVEGRESEGGTTLLGSGGQPAVKPETAAPETE